MGGSEKERTATGQKEEIGMNENQSLDEYFLQPYLFLINQYQEKQISAEDLAYVFFSIRRNDQYFMQGRFSVETQKLLDTLSLDMDAYTPPELFENNNHSINEATLQERIVLFLSAIKEIY